MEKYQIKTKRWVHLALLADDLLPLLLRVLEFLRLEEWLLPGDSGDCFFRERWPALFQFPGLLNSSSSY